MCRVQSCSASPLLRSCPKAARGTAASAALGKQHWPTRRCPPGSKGRARLKYLSFRNAVLAFRFPGPGHRSRSPCHPGIGKAVCNAPPGRCSCSSSSPAGLANSSAPHRAATQRRNRSSRSSRQQQTAEERRREESSFVGVTALWSLGPGGPPQGPRGALGPGRSSWPRRPASPPLRTTRQSPFQ